MATINKTITLQKTDSQSGPTYTVEYLSSSIWYDAVPSTLSLPTNGSEGVITIDSLATVIKLTSIGICDNEVTQSIIPPTTTTTSTTVAPTTTTTSTTVAPTTTTTTSTTSAPTTTTTTSTTAGPTTTTTTSTTATGNVYYLLASCNTGDTTEYRTGQTYDEINPLIIYSYNTLVEDTLGNYYRIQGVTDATKTSVGLVTVYEGVLTCPTTTTTTSTTSAPTTTTTTSTTSAPTTTTTTSTTVASCNCITVDVLNTQLTDGGLDLYYILNDCGGGSRDVNLAETIGSEVGGSTYFGLCSRGTTSDLFKYGPSGTPFVGIEGMNINPNGTICTLDGDCLPVTPTTTTTSTTSAPTTTTTTSTTSAPTTTTTTSTTVAPTTTTTTSTTSAPSCNVNVGYTFSIFTICEASETTPITMFTTGPCDICFATSIDASFVSGMSINDVVQVKYQGVYMPFQKQSAGSVAVSNGSCLVCSTTTTTSTTTSAPTTTTTTSTTVAPTTTTTTSTTSVPTTTTTTSTTLANGVLWSLFCPSSEGGGCAYTFTKLDGTTCSDTVPPDTDTIFCVKDGTTPFTADGVWTEEGDPCSFNSCLENP